jgi:hypothetical protein
VERVEDATNVPACKYDSRNLMTDYDGPGNNNDTTYKHSASGLRVQKAVGGSMTTKYYHDGLNVVAEYNGNSQLQRTYVTAGLGQNLSLTASGDGSLTEEPLARFRSYPRLNLPSWLLVLARHLSLKA